MSKTLTFQRFDLDLEAMTQLSSEELSRLDLPRAGSELTRELLKKGYSLLESDEIFSGINTSIIVGGEYYQNPEGNFYELVNALGLRYISKHHYRQRE